MNRFLPAILLTVSALSGLWIAIPVLNKWRADRLVNELCARDGGVLVFEKVELPRSSIPKLGAEIRVDDRRTPGDRFYLIHSVTDIQGESNVEFEALTVFRLETALYRSRDDRRLGRVFVYIRRGGDAIRIWHPSSHSCPKHTGEHELVKQVFIEKKG